MANHERSFADLQADLELAVKAIYAKPENEVVAAPKPTRELFAYAIPTVMMVSEHGVGARTN